MNAATGTRTVTVERDIPFPPEKIWRALTEPHLIQEWLMKNDFAPDIGRKFTLSGDWGSVDCEVLEIEPNQSLSYSWNAMGLESTVTFTLTKTGTGTRLRMDQVGFRADQEQAFRGAQYGWQKFFANLEQLLAKES
ncbi:MAG TPA: SRPBCC domain-containing protein [Rhodanobacteraceae bacterium]|jgi:uncharacterized protein YndB with AHSA1/START domain|nr:SRPBCC domain-containing protein [Rhodanobacteraceae bacterium]